MKMGIGMFWGIILIVIGLSIVMKAVFDISVFRVLFAVFLILLGVKILVGKSAFNFSPKHSEAIFNDKNYYDLPLKDTEYSTVFGKSIFDFREAPIPTSKYLKLEFNTVFGDTEIRLPEGLPVKIKATAVFGSAKLPNNNTAVFGDATYVSDHDTTASEFVHIEVNTVFGNTEIFQ